MAVFSLLIYQVLKFLRGDRQAKIYKSGELEDVICFSVKIMAENLDITEKDLREIIKKSKIPMKSGLPQIFLSSKSKLDSIPTRYSKPNEIAQRKCVQIPKKEISRTILSAIDIG